jgi:hypothetical protein
MNPLLAKPFILHTRFACAVLALATIAAVTPLGRTDAATNEMIEMPNGLKYTDTQTGDGATATPGKKVTVHYTGWLYNNGAKGASLTALLTAGSRSNSRSAPARSSPAGTRASPG